MHFSVIYQLQQKILMRISQNSLLVQSVLHFHCKLCCDFITYIIAGDTISDTTKKAHDKRKPLTVYLWNNFIKK